MPRYGKPGGRWYDWPLGAVAAGAQPALLRLWVKVLEIPRPALYTAIRVFATLGVYSISGSVVEVLIAHAIGLMGFGMRLYDRPFAAAVLVVALLAFVVPLLPGIIARLRGERFKGKKTVFREED